MLQERCGKQAAAAYKKDYEPSTKTKDGGTHFFNYEAHYSLKLNKCFFLEVATFLDPGMTHKSLRLFELNENKEYGAYLETNALKYDCRVGETLCSSEKEWRELAKPFLED
jgi:hypothetical protein